MYAQKNAAVPLVAAEQKTNPYYLRTAYVFRLLKWSSVLLFALYLSLMLVLQRDSITYENLMYLMRDLDIRSGSEAEFTEIVFEEQQNMRFVSFQNALAVAGSSGIRLYDSSGSHIFSDGLAYTNPVLMSGDKYMLLYDAGGYEYTLFTSLARVEQRTTENKIQYADVGEGGAYCIVTRSDETKYEVSLYNSSFMRLARFYRDSYVISAAIHPEGSDVAVLSVLNAAGGFTGEVTFCSASSRETRSFSLGSALPLGASWLENGLLCVICDSGVYYLNRSGEEFAYIPLSGQTLSFFSVSDNKAPLVCQENILGSVSRILVLDAEGKTLFNEIRQERVLGITASSGRECAYIRYTDFVESVSIAETVTVPYSGRLLEIREVSGTPVLCFADRALSLNSLVSEKTGENYEFDS